MKKPSLQLHRGMPVHTGSCYLKLHTGLVCY